MNKKDKLLAKFLNNPASLKYPEIHKILLEYGFEHKRTKGSHHYYQNKTFSLGIPIPVHNNECKKSYKKQIAELIKNNLIFLKNV